MRYCLLTLCGLGFALGCVQGPPVSPAEWPRLGAANWTYAWQPDWMKLPSGIETGNTHGCVTLDADGRVYLNTESERAVMVFEKDGRYLRSFGKDLAGGLHGMEIVGEKGAETLWVTHTGLHQVRQLSMEGEVLRQWSWPDESGKYKNENQYKPTAVAVLPDGRFFVTDGYGQGWVHAYDAAGKWQFCFGGPGLEAGKFQTPHGITWDEQIQRLVVADRENRRLQVFHADGRLDRVIETPLNRPCHVDAGPLGWLVAELEGRATILDRSGKVLAHLGEQPDPALRARNGIQPELWQEGSFLSPHCAAWGPQGDIWVVDWNFRGRLNHLVRQPR